MGDQKTITFSPSDIDQGDKQQSQAVPTGEAPITFSPSDIDKTTAAPSVKMVGPNGEQKMVRPENVASMRQQNFALTPDNPNVTKAVNYNTGQVNYILPQEENDFQQSGHAIVEPDGGIRYPIIRDKNGVIFQDPLEEQKAHERVFQALNAEEKSRNNSYELKEFGKAGLGATAAVATVPLGGVAADVAPELGGTILSRIGTAGGQEFLTEEMARQAGQQVVKQGAKWVAKKAAPYVVGATAMGVAKKTGLLDAILELF